MLNYLFRRLGLLFITAFILTILTFTLTCWTSYPQAQNANYIIGYLEYILSLLQGEWGLSVINQQPILSQVWPVFASTLELCFISFIIATIIAMPLGIIAALERNKLIDYIIMTMVLIGLALPVFWLATLSTLLPNLIGIKLPIDGDISPVFDIPNISGFLLIDTLLSTDTYHFDAFFNRLLHLTLPSTVLSLFLISEITRLTRHSVITVMKNNYIKAAQSKGLSYKQIVFNHVLKNALPPILHQIRLQLSTIISFAMVIEIIFSMHGTGTWLLKSIKESDYIALPTAVLLISGFILLISISIDILLVIISPIRRKSLYAN